MGRTVVSVIGPRPGKGREPERSGAVRGPERAPWGRPRAGPRTRREPELRRRAARIPSAAAQGPQSRLGQCPERAGPGPRSGQPRSGPCSNLKRVARKRIPRGTPRVRGGRCPWRCLVVKHKEDIARSLVLASQRTSIKHPLCEARKEWTLRVLSQTSTPVPAVQKCSRLKFAPA
jgi:hypothetical protein